MNDLRRQELKRACAKLGIEFSETYHCLQAIEIFTRMEHKIASARKVVRCLRALSPMVQDSGNAQLNEDFKEMLDYIGDITPDVMRAQVRRQLEVMRAYVARAGKARKYKPPFTLDDLISVKAKLGPKAIQAEIAEELGVSVKTYTRLAEKLEPK